MSFVKEKLIPIGWLLAASALIGGALGVQIAHADPYGCAASGMTYDPLHGVCAPGTSDTTPGFPSYGTGTCGGSGFYDPVHNVCSPSVPAQLPPFYQPGR